MGAYVAGDTFRVQIGGGVVSYLKNGVTLYTSSVSPTYPILVDTALLTTGATLNAVSLGGVWAAPPAPPTAPVAWTSIIGVTANANSLTKSGATGWNAGAVSSQQLASGDGYVEVIASETNTYRAFGLSNGNPGVSYTEIDFGINLSGSGSATIYENGIGRLGLGAYATGDTFRVEVTGNVVSYLKNGASLYTSTISPTYPLLVDTAVHTNGATLNSVVVSGVWTTPAVWTSPIGVAISGNSLTKTGLTGWNAGAISVQQIASGSGYVEVVASETNTYRAFGLSNGNPGVTYAEIDYTINLSGSGSATIYENGIARLGLGTYATGDVFRVQVVGGVVSYLKNGLTLYSSTVTPTYPLIVDTALHTNGCTLNAVVLGGAWVMPATPPTTPVTWLSPVGVTAVGNSLTKTGTTGWNAGAVSGQTLGSGDGYVEITATETTSYRAFGLSNGNPGVTYTEIDFAINLAANGTATVYENGTARVGLGTYATGDKFRVQISGGVVFYQMNGATLYTSTVSPSYPLIVDSALYTNGATLNAAVLGGAW
jgi:hypothetical protein